MKIYQKDQKICISITGKKFFEIIVAKVCKTLLEG